VQVIDVKKRFFMFLFIFATFINIFSYFLNVFLLLKKRELKISSRTEKSTFGTTATN